MMYDGGACCWLLCKWVKARPPSQLRLAAHHGAARFSNGWSRFRLHVHRRACGFLNPPLHFVHRVIPAEEEKGL